jgi:hypothetical protein
MRERLWVVKFLYDVHIALTIESILLGIFWCKANGWSGVGKPEKCLLRYFA